MPMTRTVGRGQKSPVDEEFLKQLYQGSELLAQGRLVEAKEYLERAHQLQPRNEKSQNLLGLAYFKLGQFDRAAEVYEALVRDNPVDATLRVNLGLVYLKTSATRRAVREFETATDLQPDHTKAHNYLGLALAQAGEYGRAREHFLKAGSDVMAEKMARAIAGERFAPSRRAPAPASAAPSSSSLTAPASSPQAGEGTEASSEGGLTAEGSILTIVEAPSEEGTIELLEDAEPEAAFAETSAAVEASEPLPEEEPRGEPEPEPELPARAVAFQPGGTVPLLSELAPAVMLAGASEATPFRLGNGSFSAWVEGELLTRLKGLVAFTGRLQFQPEMKRQRGRATDVPFGEEEERLVRVSGQGVLFLESEEARSFLAVDLGEDGGYFREDCVFAFEEPVAFENGKVPSEVEPDLELVHLTGQGRVLLRLSGALRSVPVLAEVPVTVPLTHLVGWQGRVSPRVVSLLAPETGSFQAAVELSGEGFALISLPLR